MFPDFQGMGWTQNTIISLKLDEKTEAESTFYSSILFLALLLFQLGILKYIYIYLYFPLENVSDGNWLLINYHLGKALLLL